jgi:hypothetical protein
MSAMNLTADRSHYLHSTAQAPSLTVERAPHGLWDSSVASFDEISQEQTYAFANRRWPSLDHEPLLFRRDREIVGGALMMVQRLPLGLGSIAIGKWAPMLKNAQRADRQETYSAMIELLVRKYAVERGMMLSILTRPQAEAGNDDFGYLRQRGFKRGTNVSFPDRYIVNLQSPDQQHRSKLHSKWRYHLGKSEKAGLTFECAGADQFPQFAELYMAMSDRKKFPDHSAYETVPALLSMPEDSLRPSLFFVRHGGNVVAGAVIFTAGDTAAYLYGATSDAALPLRAGYFLHWNIISWLKRNARARWYDLGGSDGFLGLHQFKKGMVGDAGVVTPLPAMANFSTRRLPMLIGTGAFTARDILLNVKQKVTARFSDHAKPDLPRSSQDV